MTDLEIAEEHELIRIVNGSQLYGTNTKDSDLDQMAVFFEPPEAVFGRAIEHARYRTQPEGVKSTKEDTDFISYSLRKFAHLASQGNPSVLTLLFAKDDAILNRTSYGRELQQNAYLFASKSAYPRFRGYLDSQKKRFKGEKKGHVPSRPELVEKFGYDTKYAMHMVRLGLQGIEFLTDGRLELPLHKPQRSLCRDVRAGKFSYDECLGLIEEIEDQLEEACRNSTLPEEPSPRIPTLVADLHLSYWE